MENDYGKIFAEVLDIINNSEKEDWDNNISEETKEILALIYRDYIVSPEERKELIKEEAEFEKQKELELREKYNPDNLFKNKHKEINKEIEKENETAIVQYHESILIAKKKFFNKKNFFFCSF